MQNQNEVMSQAFDGHVIETSIELGISDKRIYQILSANNPYTKLWRLLNPLGRLAPDRLGLVRADFNARCDRILHKGRVISTPESLHRQLSEAIQAVLAKASKCYRKQQILEAIAELQSELEKCGE